MTSTVRPGRSGPWIGPQGLARRLAPAALAAVAGASLGAGTGLAASLPPAGSAVDLAIAAAAGDAAPQPNIVVVMLDDTNPHDGRLWSAERMPRFHELVISRGIEFSDFHAEVPLCGPSRANLLTGQYAHNSGVGSNNGQALDPTTTIATELEEAGYHTSYSGKYLNGYRQFSPDRYDPPGWDDFDVINSNQGKYFYYQIRDRDGNITQHRTDPADYSTDVIADLAVQRIRQAPADQPLFSVISLFTPHEPLTAAPRHEGDERCRDIEPWAPPNYDEADVSDKPAYIADAPSLDDDGFDLVAHCEALLSVDELIGRVGDALADEGRLDDTVFVVLADNGMTWGEHRRTAKSSPYATAVPAFAAWPGVRGTQARVDATTLSMIDLAPTFCELGGCEMGPYPGGQAESDGLSFATLLADQPFPYQRESVLHAMPTGGDRAVWWSLRTTGDHPAGRWQYVEYSDGFRELYDISGGPCHEWSTGMPGDPCQLDNVLAGQPDPAMAELAETFAAELAELRVAAGPGRTTTG